MYLPQFHEIEENNRWWGKGFTEWFSVRNARSLFEGHKQPKVPLSNNYYNLLNKEVMQWQAELMAKYGVDGLCVYHYWFGNGNQLLQKPAENLLVWDDVSIPFFFCWANSSWVRSWSKFSSQNKFTWNYANEPSNKSSDDTGILMEQVYGNEEEWKRHFEYLLPFFNDERYIKIDNKPVFMIYVPQDITCIVSMIELWRELAVKNGFNGIFFISNHEDIDSVDAYIDLQPQTCINNFLVSANSVKEVKLKVNFDDIWEMILKKKYSSRYKTYLTAMPGYDDTPRREHRGWVITDSTPSKFEKYFAKLYRKSQAMDNEFIFINAWNEWGEGMYLEPDEENGFGYLEAVKNAKQSVLNENIIDNKEIYYNAVEDEQNQNRLLHNRTMKLFDQWLLLHEKGLNCSKKLLDLDIKSIAIYGYGVIGKHLRNELQNSEINVNYVIDKNINNNPVDIEMIHTLEHIKEVDAIIVCVPRGYDDIYKELRKHYNGVIKHISEILQ